MEGILTILTWFVAALCILSVWQFYIMVKATNKPKKCECGRTIH